MDNVIWNNVTYNKLIKYLFEIKDEKYAKFHSKLLKNDNIMVIGIKTPILRKIAKKISQTSYLDFIKLNKHKYYEEILLHGLVISYLKLEFNEIIKLFNEYIIYINNWASCDIVVSSLKIFKKNQELGFTYINKYLKNKNPWINRVGIVLLINYYINEAYIDKIFSISNNIQTDNYYVKMANAWLISMCLVKYYEKTYNFLLNNKLDNFTYNKAISKSIESLRIKNKNELRKLRKTI